MSSTSIAYVCPVCRVALRYAERAWHCADCGRAYPVIYGIPDFRLQSDAYLDLESERSKARALAAKAEHATFDELLDYYYSITDDVPPELARVYKRSILNGPAQLQQLACDMDERAAGALFDIGCGSGSLLVALALRARDAVGVDIALRWLVICRKRLAEAGIERTLVCADVVQHPFPARIAAGIACIDVIEHTRDMAATARAIADLLAPGGRAWFTVANRYAVGPHPSTRLWGIGYLPKRVAGRVSRMLRGVDSLRYVQLTTPAATVRVLKSCGFASCTVGPRRITTAVDSAHPWHERLLIRWYVRLSQWRPTRWLLVWIGPIAEIEATLPSAAAPS